MWKVFHNIVLILFLMATFMMVMVLYGVYHEHRDARVKYEKAIEQISEDSAQVIELIKLNNKIIDYNRRVIEATLVNGNNKEPKK